MFTIILINYITTMSVNYLSVEKKNFFGVIFQNGCSGHNSNCLSIDFVEYIVVLLIHLNKDLWSEVKSYKHQSL